MFPDVAAEEGFTFATGDRLAHEGIILVGGAGDFQLALGIFEQPDPAAAEASEAAGFELFLESGEGAEGGIDAVGQGAGGFTAGSGGHEVPEEGMVPMAAAIVADGSADGIGDGSEIGEEGFDGFGFEGGMAGEGFVQVVHIGFVMATMVDFHGGGVDVGFESLFGVGELGKFVCHNGYR